MMHRELIDLCLYGVKIIECVDMVDYAGEDWSRVRSPGRARRRRRKHRQNITARYVPSPTFYAIGNEIHCHPERAKQLREALDKQVL